MKLKSKQVLWLSDYTIKEVPSGGAEITDNYVIEAAKSLGIPISVVIPKNLKASALDSSDLVVLSNCYEFPKPAIDKIIETKPFIIFCHDSGRWLHVAKKHPLMFQRAVASIFLSPNHRGMFKKFLDSSCKTLLIPPHISQDFYNRGEQRKDSVLFVGNIHDGKGVLEIIEIIKDNPATLFDFYYGRAERYLERQLKQFKNCNLKGFVNQKEMYNIYNLYKYFIHLPKCHEAFGRAVGEALLCGCEIIANNNIGALSYGWGYKEFRKNTLVSQFKFWEDLEKYI